MNSVKVCQLLVLTFVLLTGLTGCRKGPKSVTLIPGKNAPTVGDGGGSRVAPPFNPNAGNGERTRPLPPVDTADRTALTPGASGLPQGEQRLWDLANFNPDREALSAQTVYFEFDKSTIQASERPKIEAAATALKTEPRAMVQIEGHCDERGTPEYNRALGERRALAVREYLATLGVAGERIATISYGEDQPADPGHNEVAWAKNRRGVFVLLRPKQ